MTVQETLEILHGETREDALYIYDREDRPYILAEAERMAIQALEEREQYRALGTVEELKEALEKQIPKKVIVEDDGDSLLCPSCGLELMGSINDPDHDPYYCFECGQALKWGEEDG